MANSENPVELVFHFASASLKNYSPYTIRFPWAEMQNLSCCNNLTVPDKPTSKIVSGSARLAFPAFLEFGETTYLAEHVRRGRLQSAVR